MVIRRSIVAWVLERNQYLFAYLGNGNDFDAYRRAEGINAAGAFIFSQKWWGIGILHVCRFAW